MRDLAVRGALSAVLVVLALTPVSAAQTVVAERGAWRGISSTDADSEKCYIVSAPISRIPEGLKRDPAVFFITFLSSASGGETEISIRFGYPLAKTGHSLTIDGQPFALMTQNETAWLRKQEDESRAVSAMRAGQELRVVTLSARHNSTTDVYSLSGLTAVFNETKKRCGK